MVKPGWFTPGQAEKAAARMGMSLDDFFAEHLVVDYWVRSEHEGGDIYVLSPAAQGQRTGEVLPYSFWLMSHEKASCVFLQEGRCTIHAVKPEECRQVFHEDDDRDLHRRIAYTWRRRCQEQILGLLARTRDKRRSLP